MKKKETKYKILEVKIPKGYSIRRWEVHQDTAYVYCEPSVKWEICKISINKKITL